MAIQVLNPEGMYHSKRYASGMKAGNLITTAGRVPLALDGSVVAPGDAAAQTAHILRELDLILKAGGASLQDVVHIHTYFQTSADMPEIHRVRQEMFGDHYPPHTGTNAASSDWKRRGIQLEIEVTAVCSG
jgi:2-iminobutanoate/2-iminopropanoate deaminase